MKKNILRKPGFWVGLVIFLAFALPIFFATYNIIYVLRLPSNYEAIRKGDSIQRVVQLMGHPLKRPINNDPPTTWDDEPSVSSNAVTSRTVTTYWYEGFVEQYAIGFDAQGRAVSRYCLTSP